MVIYHILCNLPILPDLEPSRSWMATEYHKNHQGLSLATFYLSKDLTKTEEFKTQLAHQCFGYSVSSRLNIDK